MGFFHTVEQQHVQVLRWIDPRRGGIEYTGRNSMEIEVEEIKQLMKK